MDFSDPMTARAVNHAITFDLVDPHGSVLAAEVGLAYDPADPYAVSLVFDGRGQRGEPVRWELSRDTVEAGTVEPAGMGDAELWPCLDSRGHAVTMVELSGADGVTVVLQVQTHDLRRFLDATYAVVPRGGESALLDLDGLVAALLDHAG